MGPRLLEDDRVSLSAILFSNSGLICLRARTPLHPARSAREKSRGKRALRNATVFVCRLLAEAYRLAALCFGVFLTMRGRAFREGNLAGATRSTGELKPRRTFLSRQPSSRQAVLIPPGGAPTPPRWLAANQPRRRRPFPAIRTPHECALDGNGKRNIVLAAGGSQQERFPHGRAKTRPSRDADEA
jgi:hypothetical protein